MANNLSTDSNTFLDEQWYPDGLFCEDLPTTPQPDLGKILVTGSSGYIGGRLVTELLSRGYKVVVLVRGSPETYSQRWPGVEVVVGDVLVKNSLRTLFEGVHTAYYLIHSLRLGPKAFESADLQSARNFREMAAKQGCKRIIYLGGLGDGQKSKSRHLQNRMAVARELSSGKVPVTSLRAAIIIGSGSASYEIIRSLVRRMPVLFIPHWARNKCQPIGVRDVIKYLVGVLEVPETAGETLDIGGKDILTYEDMLKTFADIIKKRVLFINLPISYIPIYSYIGSLITPVPAQIAHALIEGLKDEVVCRDDKIKQYVDFEPLSYREALFRALTREEQDKVITRWSDARPVGHEHAPHLHEMEGKPFNYHYSLNSKKTASALFESVIQVGGKNGWFDNNWMWRARGLLDRLFFGVGMIRGRKNYSTLAPNDVIDFWRVEDIQINKRLLLRAEMLLPGQAWLEFDIKDENQDRLFSINAYFYTQSFIGRLYWYLFWPFHLIIFDGLVKQIEKKS